MLYEYNAEYTRKHSATCYHEDLNSTGKRWLSLNTSITSALRGLAVKAMASQSKGRDFKSRCGQEKIFILEISLLLLAARGSQCKWNQPWHTHSQYPVSDKSSLEKNMAAVCSGISLFMLALSSWFSGE